MGIGVAVLDFHGLESKHQAFLTRRTRLFFQLYFFQKIPSPLGLRVLEEFLSDHHTTNVEGGNKRRTWSGGGKYVDGFAACHQASITQSIFISRLMLALATRG